MSPPAASVALVIDGHNLLFACYYGMPDRIRSLSGVPIHGTYGFVAAVLRMIRRFEPHVIVVCFDAEEQSFRTGIDSSYKSNRPAEDPAAFSQLVDIKRGLEYLNVRWLEIAGVEADDVMGTLARRLAKSHRVYIASTDHDMHQLIDERTYVFPLTRGMDSECGPEEIVARYGIRPAQFVDYKALVGDTSDNIRGVSGIGPKTASMLLNAFEDIPGILANLGALKARIATALVDSQDRIQLNKQLITIKTDVGDPLLEGDFSFSPPRDTDALSVRTVMRELGLML
jgi:5'-3' exonuclease